MWSNDDDCLEYDNTPLRSAFHALGSRGRDMHLEVDGLTVAFQSGLNLKTNPRSRGQSCTQVGNLKIIPVLLKYTSASQYREVFFPLVVAEAEDEEKTEKTKIIEDVELSWGEKAYYACFQIPYEKAEELKLKKSKEVCLKYTGAESSWWEATGRIIELPDENDEDEFVVNVSAGMYPTDRKPQLVSLSLVWSDVKTSRMISAIEKLSAKGKYMNLDIYNNIMGKLSNTKTYDSTIPKSYKANNLNPLNDSQRAALKSALDNSLTLIQGPPGTGKTLLAATIVFAIVACVKVKILVCAASNVATDNLAEKLHLVGLKVVRICSRAIENEYKTKAFPTLHTMKEEIENFKKRPDDTISSNNWAIEEYFDAEPNGNVEDFIIDRADVVVYTCVGSGDYDLEDKRFHTVLIDEATQATEPECLIPIVKGCERLILIGDHKQLGPVVVDDKAKDAGYRQSLFERFIKLGYPINTLDQQYRMHPNIAAFPSQEFYQNKLLNGINIQDRLRPQSHFPWPNPAFPLMFLSNLGRETKSEKGFSFCNGSESTQCLEVIRKLIQDGVKSSRISVITFYEGQRIMLTKNLKSWSSGNQVEVVNVDAFQGREKDYIIISCVRSNPECKIGFLYCPRRLNVALTRAKYGLVIVGNPHTLSRERLWRRLINFIKDRKALVSGPLHQLQSYTAHLNSTPNYY